MDFLFELLLELIAEGTVALSKNIKVPKYIRYPLIGLIVLFFMAVIGIILLTGILSFAHQPLLGLILIGIGVFMLVMGIIKFKKTYLSRKKKA